MKITRVGQEWELSAKEKFDAWSECSDDMFESDALMLLLENFNDIDENENLCLIKENIRAFSGYFRDGLWSSPEYRDYFLRCVKEISERNYLLEDYK